MIEKDNLSIKIEKYNNQYDGYHFNAKIIFEYKDIILSEYHLDVLSGRFCRIWNSDFTVNLYNENTIIIEIDNEWFDDELYDKLYGIEQKQALQTEMFNDAKEVFEMQIKEMN